jgi:hypothetical protein
VELLYYLGGSRSGAGGRGSLTPRPEVANSLIDLITHIAWGYTKTASVHHAIQFVLKIHLACEKLAKELNADRS